MKNKLIILFLFVLAAVSCSKDPGPVSGAVEFSAYTGGMATKAASMAADSILGHWVDSTSTFVPGSGIGVFAFYQKAKSNGYSVYFNSDVGEPTFMYNQKLERTTSDGISYKFEYSPFKYWPNNPGDRLSFFAYAPYDEDTVWEDLQLETNLKGDRVSRSYILEEKVEDQTDFLWADPVLNMENPGIGAKVDLNFVHICSRIGVKCKINIDDDNNFITIDRIVLRAKFNTSGDYIYRTVSLTSAWENLEPSILAKDYVQYESLEGFRCRTGITRVGGEGSFLFPFPGTQDIELVAYLTHNVKVGPEEVTRHFSGTVRHTFSAMELKEGMAYDFFLKITLDPIDIGTVHAVDWSLETIEYIIPEKPEGREIESEGQELGPAYDFSTASDGNTGKAFLYEWVQK